MDEKKVKLEEKEDRISHLPDCIIHHILSFLPSTKQAIQTGVLSKRWQNQWARVPVVIFNQSGMSKNIFSKFIDNALCFFDRSNFKIKKFCIEYDSGLEFDIQFTTRISFARRKNVEELTLKCYCATSYHSKRYRSMFPEILYCYAHLVKLQVHNCMVLPNGSVNWKKLKELNFASCKLSDQVTEYILSGSPVLESLEVHNCSGFKRLVIASKSLKRLVLVNHRRYDILRFLCPNLVELNVRLSPLDKYFSLSNLAIETIFSGSPLLKSLELYRCWSDKLVISTKNLQRLVLKELKVSVVEISGPNLKELELENLDNVKSFKLMDVPPSISTVIDWGKAFVNSKNFVGRVMFTTPQRS